MKNKADPRLTLLIAAIVTFSACTQGSSGIGSSPTGTIPSVAPSLIPTGPAMDAPAPAREPDLLSFDGSIFYRPYLMIGAETAPRVEELARWGRGTFDDIEYSPDGSIIALASSLGICIYDPESLQELRVIPTSGWITGMAFSPDGSRIVSGSKDGMVELWDAETGQQLLSIRASGDEITGVAYSSDDRFVAYGSADGRVHIWSARSGLEVRSLVTARVCSRLHSRLMVDCWDPCRRTIPRDYGK
jgi:hypothetical protein